MNLEIYDLEPKLKENLNQVFQINEIDVAIISGKLVVIGCMENFRDAKRIKLENGIYRVRVYYVDLDTLSEEDLDGEDCYEIEIWKTDKVQKLRVHKIRPMYNSV
ncbi:MAG: hypothetical protein JKY44_09025 [Flavobacteriaceae bacterium]|nr:hypothetical protein [Flavobacteriaceae bacterium]